MNRQFRRLSSTLIVLAFSGAPAFAHHLMGGRTQATFGEDPFRTRSSGHWIGPFRGRRGWLSRADLSPLGLVGAGIAGIGLAVLTQHVIPAA
jgi:hypothetical protein